jgi:hypothetical protein
VIIGIDAEKKAHRTAQAILERTSEILHHGGLPPFTSTYIEVIGSETLYGPHARTRNVREVMMRVVANHPQKAALAMFAREITPSGTSWAPGTTSPGGGRPAVSPLIKPFSFLLDKEALHPSFVLDGTRHAVAIAPGSPDVHVPPASQPDPWQDTGEPSEEVRLIDLAYGRCGDKGNISNIGLVARRPEWLPLLWNRLQPQVVEAYFAHLPAGKVTRFYLPGTASMNLLVHDALDGGGPSSMRMDPLGKGMAQMLLDIAISVPSSVASQTRAMQSARSGRSTHQTK